MVKLYFSIAICFLSCSFSIAQDTAVQNVSDNDTLNVSDVFDPNSNLDAIERVEELTLEINDGMGGVKHFVFNIATPAIMFLSLLFMVFLCFFLPLVFVNNYIYLIRYKIDRRYIAQIHEMVCGYLISQDDSPPPILNRMTSRKRRLLLQYVSEKTRYFGGEINQRLIALYRANVDISKISGVFRVANPEKLASVARQGTFLQPREEVAQIIQENLNSKNSDLRLWATILYLNVYPGKFVEIMKNYKFMLREWDEVVYYDFLCNLNNKNIVIDTTQLLQSANQTVVDFAVKISQINNS